MDIGRINKEIKEKGFEKVDIKYQKIKVAKIWEDRNKKNLWGGQFKDREKFIEWYLKQPRVCACCGVEEDFVRRYFYKNKDISCHKMTRGGRRGHMLELDKIDNKLFDTEEKYYEGNCQLLCYACNNAKSNLCNDNSFFEPIAKGIKEFWRKQKDLQK